MNKQLQNTYNWVLSVKIQLALQSGHDEEEYVEGSHAERRASLAPTAEFSPVTDGDLMLLADAKRITVVAVLPWDEEQKLIVPLSRHEYPACITELIREHSEYLQPYQQVFQVWNARTVGVKKLRGWWQEHLREKEIEELKRLLRYYLAGEPFPEELRDRTGISNPPRTLFKVYFDQEQENLAELY